MHKVVHTNKLLFAGERKKRVKAIINLPCSTKVNLYRSGPKFYTWGYSMFRVRKLTLTPGQRTASQKAFLLLGAAVPQLVGHRAATSDILHIRY